MRKPRGKVCLAVVWTIALVLGAVSASGAEDASFEDVARLQEDLANLEADLAEARLSDAERERVEWIREEVVYIKVKMRKHEQAGGEGTGVSREEVRDLRLDIADLRSDLRDRLRAAVSSPSARTTIPAGTEFDLRLEDTLSSETASPGDRFTAAAAAPVLSGGDIAIEAGTRFHGTVELVDSAGGRTDRTARLVLVVDGVEVGGTEHEIEATVLKASESLETGLGSEAKKIGLGAGLGTVLGAVLGGKKGAVVGAVAGGTGAVLATEGREVQLPRGTILHVRLDEDLTLASQ